MTSKDAAEHAQSVSGELQELLGEAERAHGHLCAGQILGVRMAQLALRRLGIYEPRRKFLDTGELNPDRKRPVVFVEIDRCATDAIAVVSGARIGKRALKLRDWGKMAATFVDLDAKLGPDYGPDLYKGIRLTALETSKDRARELFPGLPKNDQQMRAYRELNDDELFAEQWVQVPLHPSDFPGFKSDRTLCAQCGEGINFERFETRDNQTLCLPCAHPSFLYYQPL